jgi:hypothetical protein
MRLLKFTVASLLVFNKTFVDIYFDYVCILFNIENKQTKSLWATITAFLKNLLLI